MKGPAAPAPGAAAPRKIHRLATTMAIAACVAVFYWVPMASTSTSIQWDAADVHYPMQKYFSDRFSPRELPLWTPYVLSGYPILSNPGVAAWYPPHWPFFLAGITPRSIQLELAFNAFLACLGAYLFLARHVKSRMAAILGAFAYGLSGFFAGHASHVSLFAGAALFPWLLLNYRRAVDVAPVRYTALGGLVGAALILAGSGEAAVCSFVGLGLYAFADHWRERRGWLRTVAIVGFMLVGALAAAAIQVLPARELARYSGGGADSSPSLQGVLHPEPLMTLVAPDWLGTISGGYKGPSDITQYYFYAGLFVLPLAAIGAVKSRMRLPGLLLIVPPAWYMLGPAGGLYYLGALVPGLHKLRAPVEGWFLVALGFALLAAAGGEWMFARWHNPFLPILVVGLLFVDVWYWNSLRNPLAYARASFDEVYGSGEEAGRIRVAMNQPPLTRFYAPGNHASMGPALHPLDLKLEATYGSSLLEPGPYKDYLDAIERNPKLRHGLNVSRFLNVVTGRIDENTSVLPRAYFPKAVTDVTSLAESRQALETLDPAAGCVVLSPHSPIRQDPDAAALVVSSDEQWYRFHYHAVSPSLLKLSVAWYPGWRAEVAGKELPILHVDHALMGVVVPPGDNEVAFTFHSNYFGTGLAISLIAGLVLLASVRGGRPRSHRKRKKRSRSKRPAY
ncbi:MAG: YfhO family protein [Bryobacteraceae bacterium]